MAKIHPNTSRRYPELDIPDDEEVRKRLSLRINGYGVTVLWVMVGGGAGSLAFDLVIKPLEAQFEVVPGRLWQHVILFCTMVAAAYAAQWWSRAAVRRQLRRDLRDLGYAVCLKCGYDMRGLPEDRCPECGARFGPPESGSD